MGFVIVVLSGRRQAPRPCTVRTESTERAKAFDWRFGRTTWRVAPAWQSASFAAIHAGFRGS